MMSLRPTTGLKSTFEGGWGYNSKLFESAMTGGERIPSGGYSFILLGNLVAQTSHLAGWLVGYLFVVVFCSHRCPPEIAKRSASCSW